jgi:hypothetical protein
MTAMPAAPSDRRILVFAIALVAFAGILIAAALFFATGGGKGDPKQTGPLYLGLASDLRSQIAKGSPLYFANPFGGNGFWLDRQNGSFVALALVLPHTHDCEVKWKGRQDSYVDCHGDKVTIDDLDQYKVSFRNGGNSGRGLYVDLRRRIPAAASVTTVPTSSPA